MPHLFEQVLAHGARPALHDGAAAWSFAQLVGAALRVRDALRDALPAAEAERNPRVAFLGSRGASYVAMQWGVWLAGGVCVPLHAAHPATELQYILDDSAAALLVVSDEFLGPDASGSVSEFIEAVKKEGKVPVLEHARPVLSDEPTPPNDQEARVREWLDTCDLQSTNALIIYTSGTTGRPKGVVSTHAGLTAQTQDIVAAWEITDRDHLLHFLPLHHIHGILNCLLCVHFAGGSVEFLPSAKADLIWSKLAESQSDATKRPATVLMAVPTVYMNLLEEMARDTPASYDKKAAVEAAKKLRVAISGSMACPVSILSRWEELTGLRLLERYGMTELGMALTNPLHGERHLGFVGQPFPSVQVRIVDPETEQEIPLESGQEGELRVRGPTVFKEYWRKPEATAKEIDADGWFKTGDIVQYDAAKKSFRIRGRASADILKSGGYKISALDIERVLLSHPRVQECAVFGIADEKWGQIVSAVVRVSGPVVDEPELKQTLTTFCKQELADYRVPRKFFFVDAIPKNAMGKVNKKALAVAFAPQA